MFTISVLKEMKLTELQEIAKIAKIKSAGVKKDELITKIIEAQAIAENTTATVAEPTDSKSKRIRIKPSPAVSSQKTLFASELAVEIEQNLEVPTA